jgi:hypothetical protein
MSLFLGPIADVEALPIGLRCRYAWKLEYFFVPVFLSYLDYRRSKLSPSSFLVSCVLFRHSFIKCPAFPQQKHVFSSLLGCGVVSERSLFSVAVSAILASLVASCFGWWIPMLRFLAWSPVASSRFGIICALLSTGYRLGVPHFPQWNPILPVLFGLLVQSAGSTALLRIGCIASNSF